MPIFQTFRDAQMLLKNFPQAAQTAEILSPHRFKKSSVVSQTSDFVQYKIPKRKSADRKHARHIATLNKEMKAKQPVFFNFLKEVDWRSSTGGLSHIWLEVRQYSRYLQRFLHSSGDPSELIV
jgi:hypothetical protein